MIISLEQTSAEREIICFIFLGFLHVFLLNKKNCFIRTMSVCYTGVDSQCEQEYFDIMGLCSHCF